MSKLKQLQSLCKCGVHLSINEHRDYYQSVEEYMKDYDRADDTDAEVLKVMIETDTVVDLQFYPRTPIGFVCINHHDVDLAIQEAIDYLNDRAKAKGEHNE